MKTNPRRHPVSQADLNRAKTNAINEAANSAMTIFFSVLCDKFGADVEMMQRVYAEVNNLSESIVGGYVNISDLKNTLKVEYDIFIS